jgi:putative tryptophan/tyrosine transport system substrate-binding protein
MKRTSLPLQRREFITLLGGGAAAWPLVARAQQVGKLPVIGFLGADAAAFSPWTSAFVTHLRELGWIENRNVAIEYRWSEGRTERYAEIAAEFVRLKVDVILTVGSAVPTVRQVTSAIPIVFAVAREVVPHLRKLAIIFNVGNAQPVLEMGETAAAARTLGIEVAPIEIRRVEDFGPAFAALKATADALYVAIDQLMVANLMRILTLALGARLPTIFSTRDFVRGGGFMSYGPSYTERFGRAADYVDKILRGTKPGDIPVEQPTKFELVVNLITAQALDVRVPPSLLAIADEVIDRIDA